MELYWIIMKLQQLHFLKHLVPYAITEDHDRVYQALREKYQISSGIVIGD